MKFCPLKFSRINENNDLIDPELICQCEQERCAWWNESLGVCGIVAEAYLKGLEVERKERCLAPEERK